MTTASVSCCAGDFLHEECRSSIRSTNRLSVLKSFTSRQSFKSAVFHRLCRERGFSFDIVQDPFDTVQDPFHKITVTADV